MTLEECYKMINGDYNDVLSRFQKESLVERFLLKFPNDKTMELLKNAVAEKNIEESFRAAHTLKGITINLSLGDLTVASTRLTDQLKPCVSEADPELLADVEREYAKVIETINAYISEKQ